ncbi:MAG: hypothetical protein ABSA30_10150 [Candidatus Aminicenantales bacterium]|jgi:hypothetical protein
MFNRRISIGCRSFYTRDGVRLQPAPRKKDQIRVLSPQGRPIAVPVKIGLSDNIVSELVEGALGEGRLVITGMRTPR